MASLKSWMVLLTAGGSAIGAAVALGSVPGSAGPAGPAKVQSAGLTVQTDAGASDSQLSVGALTAEVARVQRAVATLEAQIKSESSGPAGSLSQTAGSGGGATVQAEAAQLANEKQQLDAEAAALARAEQSVASERSSLSQYQTELEDQAKQLSSEEQQFAAQQRSSTAPQPSTTTSSTAYTGGDGGVDR